MKDSLTTVWGTNKGRLRPLLLVLLGLLALLALPVVVLAAIWYTDRSSLRPPSATAKNAQPGQRLGPADRSRLEAQVKATEPPQLPPAPDFLRPPTEAKQP